MRTYRTFFQENYIARKTPANNKQGYKVTYQYIGMWYGWNIKNYKMARILYGGLGLLNTVIFTICGTRKIPVNYVLTVETLVLLAVIPMLFENIGLIQFCIYKNAVTEFTFREISRRLKVMPLIHSILLVLAAAAGVLYSVKGNFLQESFLILVCYLVCAAISAYIAISFHSFRVVTECASLDSNTNTETQAQEGTELTHK